MKDRNLIILAGGALIIILVIILVLTKPSRQVRTTQANYYSTPTINQEESEMNVLLTAQNNSGESGVASLKDTGGMATVTLNLTGYESNVVQPAHIHAGKCPGVGTVKYPLNSVVNGKSVTVLDVSVMQLKQQLPLAINVHKSTSEVFTYTSCGAL